MNAEAPFAEAEEEKEPIQEVPEQPEAGASKWRDATTTIIAILIVIVALYLIIAAFWRSDEVLALDSSTVENQALYQAQLDQQQNARDQRKDILLIAVGILGTVTGYYFGRTPAERRAEGAERHAKRATEESRAATRQAGQASERADEQRRGRDQAQQRLHEAKRGIKRIAERLDPAAQQARATLGTGGPPSPAAADLLEARTELEALAESLPD